MYKRLAQSLLLQLYEANIMPETNNNKTMEPCVQSQPLMDAQKTELFLQAYFCLDVDILAVTSSCISMDDFSKGECAACIVFFVIQNKIIILASYAKIHGPQSLFSICLPPE